MNIAVDLRALSGDKISGVKVYLLALLEEIFQLDKKNRYFLWWNSATEDFPKNLKIPRSPRFKKIHTKFSNRTLNLRLILQNSPPLDRLILDSEKRREQLDLFWLPDPRPVALSENCRLITTIHDLSPTLHPEFFSMKTRVWHRFLNPKKIAQKSDKILAVSNSTKNDLEKFWEIPRAKITATPLSASAKLKRVQIHDIRRTKVGINLPPKFVLSLSTLEPRKNLQTLIRAFAEFKNESNSPVELVLAGSFDRKIFADPKINPRDISGVNFEWLHFLGFIEEKDKSALLSAAEAFCFPSIYEGFGIPPLEAMTCGVPVLASNISALREVCGDAAKLLPPKNVDAWRVALQKILSDEKLREDLRRRGIRQSKKFSWKKTAEKTIAAFEKLDLQKN
ncbi:MAG: glycosyltransferase family 1 protein [Patescibacteria group bacterium]